MPSPEKISGYQLAEHLLCEGGVEALIRYARKSETDWLELKAGMCLLPEHKKQGKTEKDLYWNIAKEVIALMNTSGGALVIGVKDETLNLVSLEDNDPRHIIAEKSIDCYIRDFVRANVWPSNLMWSDYGKPWELTDKQFPADLISYHHPSYTGPDGRSGEVVVLLIKPVEKIRLARKEQKYFALFKRTRGEVGEAQPIFDPDVIDEYKTSREIASAFYANIRDQFDEEKAATSESATLAAAIKEYYNGLVEKSRKMRAVFTSLDAEENVFSKDDVDQFYSPEAIETFDDEDRWLDDDDNEEEEREDNDEEEEDSDFDEDSDEGALDSEDDTEDEDGARSARNGDLLELLKSEQRVIVSGEPGGGKTTCLTYFTLKFAERGDDVPVLAVFIPMGQWRRGGSLSLMMERATGLDAGQLAHLMSENRLRLVIDAVNECPDDFRVAAIQNIGMFLAEHPTVPAVISTRHPKELSALHLPVFHVQPMDETHRLHYLERYLQDGEQAQKLLHQLGGMPGGETVAENPMLLRLVVEVYKESPEKRLPNGRAGLYRRSLRAWYKRENEKAEKAGTKLQWNRRQTFELLAVLAFKSRQRGYRDVPLDEISAIWGADAENQLEVLCQGPIIYCDDEFVRFRHETFQEYLCAEYLVAHQNELPSWTQGDYAQWGMPFAYAVELIELDKQQLPESFWLAAWSLNPWLGVALTDENKGRQLLNPRYHGTRPMIEGKPLDISSRTPYLRAVCYSLNERSIRYALGKDTFSWYMHEDVALRYVIFVSMACQSRWNCFEISQLQCLTGVRGVQEAIKLSKSWVTLSNPRNIFQCHAPDNWNAWIENASPSIAELLVEAKIALPDDFCEHKSRWRGKISREVILRLFSKCILDLFDIEKLFPSLLEKAVRVIANKLNGGYGDNSLIGKNLRHWISDATPRMAIALIKNGLATKEAFKSRLSEWLKDNSIPSAILLARAGLASKVDFECVLQKWVSCATPQMAAELVEVGLMSSSDFSSRLSGWLQHPQYSFVQKYLQVSGELENVRRNSELVRQWLVSASIDSVALLFHDGLVASEDLKNTEERLTFWGPSFMPKRILELQLIDKREWVDLNARNRAVMRACCDIKKGIKCPSDFASDKNTWIQSSNLSMLVRLVQVGIVKRKEIDGLIKQWISSATPQTALRLLHFHLAEVKDFVGRIRDWMSLLEPQVALELIKRKIICEKDIDDVKRQWRSNIEPMILPFAIRLGYVTLDEAVGYLKVWGDVVPKHIRAYVRRERMKTVIDKIHVGQNVRGKVKDITDLGVFVDLVDFNGIDGLIRPTEISWGRIINPSELLEIGQDVNGKVTGAEYGEGYVLLGLKQTTENHWSTIEAKFPIGKHVTGKVVKLVANGVFVEVAPGIEGFVHISEFSWTKRMVRPSDMLNIGNEVIVSVLLVDAENHKIAFSIRQTVEDPWNTMQELHPVGSCVKGRVRCFTNSEAFIVLEDGIDGMIRISEMSWERKIHHPFECLQIRQEITAVVLNVDPSKRVIALSLKQLQRKFVSAILSKYMLGTVVVGRIIKLAKDEALLELEPGIEGMIHVSEISADQINNVKDVLNIGDEVTARIVKIDTRTCRIHLSINALSMTDSEVNELKNSTEYRNMDLFDPIRRILIEHELRSVWWDMTISSISDDQSYLLFSHPSFKDGVRCAVRATRYRDRDVFGIGQVWNVKVAVNYNKEDDSFGYIAQKIRPSKIESTSTLLCKEPPPCVMYRRSDLADPVRRQRIASELDGVRWEMIVCRRTKHGGRVLFSHPSFPDHVVFYPQSHKENFSVGQKWRVVVCAEASQFLASSVETLEDKTVCEARIDERPSPMTLPRLPLSDIELISSRVITNRVQAGGLAEKKLEVLTTVSIVSEAKPVSKAPSGGMYRESDLIDPVQRHRIDSELKSARWDMTVSFVSEDRERVCFMHPSFKDAVYCPARSTQCQDVFEVGQIWNVRVAVLQNKKDGTFGFVARSVKPSKTNPACLPRSGNKKPVITRPQEGLSPALDPNSGSHISIYIDETWPGTQDHAYENVGVIGGIVVPWEGVDGKRLPVIKTHLDNGSAARNAIQTMLGQPKVFPFVFPIKWDHPVGAGGRQYFELVQHALMLLLGWMLPQRNQPTTVDVFLEHISGYMDGHDETDFISSLTQAMRLLSGGRRFANWQIRRVEWVDKEFGYVPYGDLVCKTCVPREEQQLLAREVKVREWEGFLPFSQDVFPLLRDMDTASPSGLADLLISFAKVAEDTPFFRRVRKIAIDRAKSDATFRDAVISRFEECFAQPQRDMVLLNRVVPHFLKEFPPDLFKERPRMQLLRILIGFQHANHNGDPDLASALVEQYHSLRSRILELDRDLCAYADLNLAVHHHDSFEFDTALSLVDGWINDPLFPALSVMNRGRMFSSRGQSLALLGRNQEADGAFGRALSVFSVEPELLAQDIAQTKTYQAMNALDHDAPSAVPLVESLLGKSLIAAALDFKHVLDTPFVAHLFLKALWRMRPERSVVLDALLKNLPVDIAVRKQHPYELILFYLALLTKDANPSYAQACAREVEQFFEAIEFGGTLGLVHTYLRVQLKRHGFDAVADKDFFDELDIVEHYLPKAITIINKLRAGWADTTLPVESILPFNYC